jgi:hypothetical protein
VNVSKEADRQFMSALKREDPKRYANLVRNMEQSVTRNRRAAGACQNPKCSNDLLQFRAGTLFCSESCKKHSQRILDSENAA